MSDPVQPLFLAQFAALRDPRQAVKVLYRLPEVLLLLLCGTIAGTDDFVELALWGGEHLAFLRRFLPYAHGVPSHDTLCEVVAALDPELFKIYFANWVERLRAPAPATAEGEQAGQEAVSDKSNKITSIPFLQRLELAGALVAMGTRTAIAQAILDRGGGDLLALKQNRPETFASVKQLFARPPSDLAIGTHQTVDGGHGRIETRTHQVCHEVGWTFADRRHPDEPRFPGLAMVGVVESSATERAGQVEHETRCSLCSAKLDADTFARSAAIEASRTGCTGCSTSCSATALPGCEPGLVPPTWPWSSTWPSTCSPRPGRPQSSRTGASEQGGTQTTSPSSNTVHLGVQRPYITGQVFWDRQRWRVFLPAFQPAFVLATTSASA